MANKNEPTLKEETTTVDGVEQTSYVVDWGIVKGKPKIEVFKSEALAKNHIDVELEKQKLLNVMLRQTKYASDESSSDE